MAELATLEGFEPSVSSVKGWRAGPLHHRVRCRKREYRTSARAGPSIRPATSERGLSRGYGIRIPVVEIDGEERFEYEVDPAELRAIVQAG